MFRVSASGVVAVVLVCVLTPAAVSARLALAHRSLVLLAAAEEQSQNVTASAYNSAAPNEGAWGDEITPGMKVIAVSPDLIAAGLNRGTKVRVEGHCQISYRPLRGRYDEGPSKGPSISQVLASPASSRLPPAAGCSRG